MARSLGFWLMAMALASGGCDRLGAPAGEREAAAADTGGAPAPGPAPPDIGAAAGAGSAQRTRFEREFTATGAEPGWRLDLLRDYVSFTRPGLPAVGGLPEPASYGERGLQVKAGPLLVTLLDQPCTYGDSESFDYAAEVRYQGVTYKGCARPAGESQPIASWTGMLPELIEPIDACLARARAKPARVTIAYAAEPGAANVRLLDADGGRFECVVEGRTITYFEAIGDSDVLGGERDPLFTRAPDEPPAGECLASDPAPLELGWLTRRIC